MRLILDTNILASAFIFGGMMRRQLNAVLADEHIAVLASPTMLAELKEVLFREKFRRFQRQKELEALLSDFLEDVEIVPITGRFTACRDPKDNKDSYGDCRPTFPTVKTMGYYRLPL